MIDRNSKGFTLVELIVAIAIIGLMTTGITSLYVAIEKLNGKQNYWKLQPEWERKR